MELQFQPNEDRAAVVFKLDRPKFEGIFAASAFCRLKLKLHWLKPDGISYRPPFC